MFVGKIIESKKQSAPERMLLTLVTFLHSSPAVYTDANARTLAWEH